MTGPEGQKNDGQARRTPSLRSVLDAPRSVHNEVPSLSSFPVRSKKKEDPRGRTYGEMGTHKSSGRLGLRFLQSVTPTVTRVPCVDPHPCTLRSNFLRPLLLSVVPSSLRRPVVPSTKESPYYCVGPVIHLLQFTL